MKCLHCIRLKDTVVPRPFGHAVHATKPNEVLHYDFLFICKPKRGWSHVLKYVLVIKDDLSHFLELVCCSAADHLVVVDVLMDWFKRFGIAPIHVSDQGSHFKNQVMFELTSRLNILHHFTTPYTPWANGTVEIVNKHFLFVLKSLCSEFRLDFEHWPRLVPLVNMVLNFRIRPRVNYAPITIMTGLTPSMPLDLITVPSRLGGLDLLQSPLSEAELQDRTKDLCSALTNIHQTVANFNTNARAMKASSRNKNRKAVAPNFDVGDFVLVACDIERKVGTKLRANWRGPHVIAEVLSEWLYRVRDSIY